MAKITSRNNDLLRDSRNKVSPKVYELLIDLVNEERGAGYKLAPFVM